jgi:hypothetical protein
MQIHWYCLKLKKSSPTTRHGGSLGGGVLLILDLCIRRCESSASRPGRALPPGKGPLVPIGQEAGWPPEPVWTQRLEEKSFASAGGRNSDLPVIQSSQTLYCLNYRVSLTFMHFGKYPYYMLKRMMYVYNIHLLRTVYQSCWDWTPIPSINNLLLFHNF